MIKPTKPGRANRIADQIQRDVAELIQKEVCNPKTGLVTLHTVPQLHFVYDKSVERGFEMDQLIRQAREEDGEKVKGE